MSASLGRGRGTLWCRPAAGGRRPRSGPLTRQRRRCYPPDSPATRCAIRPYPRLRSMTRRKAARRKGPEDLVSPFSPDIEPSNRPAFRAYQFGWYGLVPGLGLLLGPLALAGGLLALRRGRSDPEFTAAHAAVAAIILGALISVCNWAGLGLMIHGLARP